MTKNNLFLVSLNFDVFVGGNSDFFKIAAAKTAVLGVVVIDVFYVAVVGDDNDDDDDDDNISVAIVAVGLHFLLVRVALP